MEATPLELGFDGFQFVSGSKSAISVLFWIFCVWINKICIVLDLQMNRICKYVDSVLLFFDFGIVLGQF